MDTSGIKEFEYFKLRHDDESIFFETHDSSVNQSMKRNNIGSVNTFYNVYLSKQTFVYCYRMVGLAILLFILSMIISSFGNINKVKLLVWTSWAIFMSGIALFFIDLLIDSFLGTNITRGLFAYFLGRKGYDVKLMNKNDVEAVSLFISKNEKEEFQNSINNLKIVVPDSLNRQEGLHPYDEIQKLSDLNKKGAITDEEFLKMKNKILRL